MDRLPGLPRGPRPPYLGPLRETPTRERGGFETGQPSAAEVEGQGAFPPVPAGFAGGPAAWAIYWAHGPLRRGPAGERWVYATPLFGSIAATGFAPDFIERDVRISIDVLDWGRSAAVRIRATQALRRVVMARFGIRHVAVDEEVALTRPIWALREALAGVEHSRA